MKQTIRFCTAADGAKLAYAVDGEGPALVLATSWLTHLGPQWRALAWQPWLDTFSNDYKLLRYDARGSGLSDRDPAELSVETWVRDLEAVVDAAGFEQFSILAACQRGSAAIILRGSSTRFAPSTATRPSCSPGRPDSARTAG